MPILDYTTKIDTHKTVGEIQRSLAKAGAMSIAIDYDSSGQPIALTFLIKIKSIPINFRLPSRYDGVLKRLQADSNVPIRLRTDAQARRVAWRIIKDWCESQLAIIDAGQAELAEVFLPYAITVSGRSLFHEFENNPQLLLPETTSQKRLTPE